jgi:hypothetical protein
MIGHFVPCYRWLQRKHASGASAEALRARVHAIDGHTPSHTRCMNTSEFGLPRT